MCICARKRPRAASMPAVAVLRAFARAPDGCGQQGVARRELGHGEVRRNPTHAPALGARVRAAAAAVLLLLLILQRCYHLKHYVDYYDTNNNRPPAPPPPLAAR